MNLPQSQNLPIKHLSSAFNNTTNSYKFYWFLAILECAIEKSEPFISLKKLLAKMISNIWYPVNYYRISFGKQDRLGNIALDFKSESRLSVDARQDTVFKKVLQTLDHSPNTNLLGKMNSLIRYVPYRFLRPWFTNELKGLLDYQINSKIVQLAEYGFNCDENLCLYKFGEKEEKHIEIPKQWFEYLREHNKVLTDFCLWNLLHYLQKNNPNVPNLAEKLFAPQSRNLNRARNFWNLVINECKNFNCIYSKIPVSENDYSIDHFIPWRFVTHDQLWNLIPVPKFVNSSKSDFLPSLDNYFDRFARIQRQAFRIVFEKNRMKLLEDYTNLYQCELQAIYEMSENTFKVRLYSTIAPLIQIAENMGFESSWTFR